MATGAYPIITTSTNRRIIRKSGDATVVRVLVGLQAQSQSHHDDEAEWQAAYASPEFARIIARARAQIAAGQTRPMRLEDL